MSNRPGAPAELPRISGDNAAPVPRPKTPRASKIIVTAGQHHGDDVVAVKQGSRATATPYAAAGVVTAVLCCIGIWIAIGVALNNNDCAAAAAEPRCAHVRWWSRGGRLRCLLAAGRRARAASSCLRVLLCVLHMIHRGALTQQRRTNTVHAAPAHGTALLPCCLHSNAAMVVCCLQTWAKNESIILSILPGAQAD